MPSLVRRQWRRLALYLPGNKGGQNAVSWRLVDQSCRKVSSVGKTGECRQQPAWLTTLLRAAGRLLLGCMLRFAASFAPAQLVLPLANCLLACPPACVLCHAQAVLHPAALHSGAAPMPCASVPQGSRRRSGRLPRCCWAVAVAWLVHGRIDPE